VLSGGDMINKGSPAWSDKYRCVEWPSLNGIVEAMAFGNHDSDYGADVFGECSKSISYPILSANTIDANGSALFARWTIVRRRGVRIGVFAVAGPDFDTLVKAAARETGSIGVSIYDWAGMSPGRWRALQAGWGTSSP